MENFIFCAVIKVESGKHNEGMFTECKDCDALRNLVPLVQFKKREKHPWRNNCTKSNSQIAHRITRNCDPWPILYYCSAVLVLPSITHAHSMKFPIKDFFSQCEHIFTKLCIYSHLLKKSLMQNFNFCAVAVIANIGKYFMKIKRWYKMVYSSSKNYVSLNLWTFTYCNYQIL